MTHDDLDKRVSAFVDGALRGSKREQFQRDLEADPRLAGQIERSRALGRLVRESWTDGPTAPSPDFLLSAIRPALAEIDRERSARPAWERGIDSVLARLTAALRPSPVLATAAAVAFIAALALMPHLEVGNALDGNLGGSAAKDAPTTAQLPQSQAPAPTGPASQSEPADFTAEGHGSVYDVAPGRPAVLFHSGDGSMMLWLIDEGDLSYRLRSSKRWG